MTLKRLKLITKKSLNAAIKKYAYDHFYTKAIEGMAGQMAYENQLPEEAIKKIIYDKLEGL